MKPIALLTACVLAPALLSAQDAPKPAPITIVPAPATTLPLKRAPKPTTAAISSDDLMTRVYLFADDSLMGREAGTKGNMIGTAYLAAEAQRIGLQPAGENGTFFQTLPLKNRTIDPMSTLIVGGTPLAYAKDWIPMADATINRTDVEVVYGGTLGDSVQLTAEQAAGKLVVLNVPLNGPAINNAVGGDGVFPSGALAVVLVLPGQVIPAIENFLKSQSQFIDSGTNEARLFMAASVMDKVFAKPLAELTLGATGAKAQVNVVVTATAIEFPARNVIALLPGSDPKLKTQFVAIGAHNDHVGMSPKPFDHDSMRILTHLVRPGGAEDNGKRATPEQQAQINAELAEWRKTNPARLDSVFNGADDDGSGSMSVLEIAEFMAAQKTKPKRSTLFVWHVGEEKGLWGSKWFTDHPTVSRDSIVAQINMDMVGRGNAWDVTGSGKNGEVLRGSPDYLQIVGSRRLSSELGDLVEEVNTKGKHNFMFDYALDANGHPMNIYCRSDHAEYARYGIPVAFFTTGGHSDYHQITDEPQYIDYPHLTRVTKFVADLVGTIGNRPHRFRLTAARPDPKGACQQ